MPTLPPILPEDREHIVRHSAPAWRDLAGSRFFITGGTGFYGKWMLEAIAAANDELGAGVRATVLSRDPARFAAEVPHLAARPELEWLSGEPARFAPPSGAFDCLIDFATPSAVEVGAGGTAIIDGCLRGTENLLAFAQASGMRRIFYASSGAVYGRQPAELERIPEDFVDDPASVSPYGRLKQRTEARLLASGIDCVISRGFAFIGPYLPLTDKFAAGSFIRDALAGGPIRIHGDGSPVRSYLYAADLAVWMSVMLAHGKPGLAYNLGSDHGVTLARLATAIAAAASPPSEVVLGGSAGVGALRYLPDTSRARHELGLAAIIDFDAAVSRSVAAARRISGPQSATAVPKAAACIR
jgi:dTDP-glucose 4,6-dehydratase